MGIPKLQTYERAFPATPRSGPEPAKTIPSHPRPDGRRLRRRPKTMVVLTSKFPWRSSMAQACAIRREARLHGTALTSNVRNTATANRRNRRHECKRQHGFTLGGLVGLESKQAWRSASQALNHEQETASTSIRRRDRSRCRGWEIVMCSTLPRALSAFHGRPGNEEVPRESRSNGDHGQLDLKTPSTAQACGMVSNGRSSKAAERRGPSRREDRSWLKEESSDHGLTAWLNRGPFNHGAAAQLVKQGRPRAWRSSEGRSSPAPGVKLIASGRGQLKHAPNAVPRSFPSLAKGRSRSPRAAGSSLHEPSSTGMTEQPTQRKLGRKKRIC